jgi:hypothetical protein
MRLTAITPGARSEVAALDRRDFQVVAPRHLPKGERLKLLPEE